MSNITISYEPNNKGKYDFVVMQNGIKFYNKTYSPKHDEMQEYLGHSLVMAANIALTKEFNRNPNFQWNSFDEFKEWISSRTLRDQALNYYAEHEKEWLTNPDMGW